MLRDVARQRRRKKRSRERARVKRSRKARRHILIALGGVGLVSAMLALSARWWAEREPRAEIAAELAALEAAGLGVEVEEVLGPPPLKPIQIALKHTPEFPGRNAPETAAIYDPDLAYAFFDCRGRRISPLVPKRSRAVLSRYAARFDATLSAVLGSDGFAQEEDAASFVPEFPQGYQDSNRLREAVVYRLALAIDKKRPRAAWRAVEQLGQITARMRWPSVGSHVVYLFAAQQFADGVVATLSLGPPETDQRARLQAQLEELEDPVHLQRALRGHLSLLLGYSRGLIEGDDPQEVELVREKYNSPEIRRWLPLVTTVFRHRFLRDRASFVRLMRRQIQAATLSSDALRQVAADVEQEVRQLDLTYSFVTQLEGPASQRFLSLNVPRARARLRMARLALALGASSELPETTPLRLLDPFGPEVSTLQWRRDGTASGLLWSVGPYWERYPPEDQVPDSGKALPAELSQEEEGQLANGLCRYSLQLAR